MSKRDELLAIADRIQDWSIAKEFQQAAQELRTLANSMREMQFTISWIEEQLQRAELAETVTMPAGDWAALLVRHKEYIDEFTRLRDCKNPIGAFNRDRLRKIVAEATA